jgi:hypothetical protein
MEFGTVHGFSSAIVREDPARGVDGHEFFQPKKTQFFWKKTWGGGVWERKLQPHSDMWWAQHEVGAELSRVEVREGGSMGTHIMDSLQFWYIFNQLTTTLHFV